MFQMIAFRKQEAKKQGLRPRKKSSFFTKVTEYFSGYFDPIDSCWVTPRQPQSRYEKILYLTSNLTNCASGGSPSNSPFRKIWEV